MLLSHLEALLKNVGCEGTVVAAIDEAIGLQNRQLSKYCHLIQAYLTARADSIKTDYKADGLRDLQGGLKA